MDYSRATGKAPRPRPTEVCTDYPDPRFQSGRDRIEVGLTILIEGGGGGQAVPLGVDSLVFSVGTR